MEGKRDNDWSIGTFKELIDEKFRNVEERERSREKALELQAVENKRRLDELNHEHARVLQAQQASVSKDTWDGYIQADLTWKGVTDRALQGAVSRAEFQLYKDATDKALTLKAGQATGRGDVVAWVIAVIASAAAIAATIIALRGK